MRIIFSLLSLFLLVNFAVAGGKKKSINIKKTLYKAEDNFYNENYRKAIELYSLLDSVSPENSSYFRYQIGLSFLYSNIHNKTALKYIRQGAKDLAHDESPITDLYLYHLGRAYHLNEKFDSALVTYNQALQGEIFDENLKSEIERQIDITNNARKIYQQAQDMVLKKAARGINSQYADYKPVISSDESTLIFTSRRAGTSPEKKYIDGGHFEDIFISQKDENGKWSTPKGISTQINSDEHEASVGLSADGRELIVYKGSGSGGLYVSRLDGADWSTPTMIDGEKTYIVNAKKSWETSASKTVDGKTMYFTSNRKKSLGGLDIYQTKMLPSGEWGEAVNLGPVINTELDEESPFIHPDGKTLYFSSRGHNTAGGYDIFKSVFENGKWSKPVNMGHPINSTSDDLHFVLTADGKKAYYTSSRYGSLGEQDIYRVSLEEKVSPLILVKGIVETEDNANPDVNITVVDVINHQRQKYIYKPNSATGKYLMILPHGKKYEMLVEADGYESHLVELEIPTKYEFHEIYQEIKLNRIRAFGDLVGQEITVVNSFENLRDKEPMATDFEPHVDSDTLLS